MKYIKTFALITACFCGSTMLEAAPHNPEGQCPKEKKEEVCRKIKTAGTTATQYLSIPFASLTQDQINGLSRQIQNDFTMINNTGCFASMSVPAVCAPMTAQCIPALVQLYQGAAAACSAIQ